MLTMQSGLAWREIYGPVGSDVVPMLYLDNSVVERAIKQPLEVAPRTKWYYSSGTSNILSWIVRKVINDDNKYWTFPAERLFDSTSATYFVLTFIHLTILYSEIGATSMVMEVDPNGTFVGSSFSYGTARDWARFGLLYLQNGLWNNERILPEVFSNFLLHRNFTRYINVFHSFSLGLGEALDNSNPQCRQYLRSTLVAIKREFF